MTQDSTEEPRDGVKGSAEGSDPDLHEAPADSCGRLGARWGGANRAQMFRRQGKVPSRPPENRGCLATVVPDPRRIPW